MKNLVKRLLVPALCGAFLFSPVSVQAQEKKQQEASYSFAIGLYGANDSNIQNFYGDIMTRWKASVSSDMPNNIRLEGALGYIKKKIEKTEFEGVGSGFSMVEYSTTFNSLQMGIFAHYLIPRTSEKSPAFSIGAGLTNIRTNLKASSSNEDDSPKQNLSAFGPTFVLGVDILKSRGEDANLYLEISMSSAITEGKMDIGGLVLEIGSRQILK